jgi:ribosomal protein S18 acetylase RimI-like enzyme
LNSALPLDAAATPDLAVVEAFYARLGVRALVQMAPAEALAGLDAALARRGWSAEGATDVLVAEAAAVLARTAEAAPADVTVAPRPHARWIASWAACEGRADAAEHAREVLARIEPETGYALAPGGAGVGLATCERGWAGIFCLATAAHARRRGVARAVIHALTGWATERGARRIYLLVERDNAPAHALYARTGFSRSHGYHYRAAPA